LFELKHRYRHLGCTVETTRMLDDFCAVLLEKC
jgi:hypothetical protein